VPGICLERDFANDPVEDSGDIGIGMRCLYDRVKTADDERQTKVLSNLLKNDRMYMGVSTMYNNSVGSDVCNDPA
jgi:hypothetical protein